MSKTTKIIAALGVVAGLGVASLPLASYAEGETQVSGNVEVEVQVLPAIAMKIHSNADQTCSGDPEECTDTFGAISYNPVSARSSSDPAAVAGPSQATGLKLAANSFDGDTLYSDVYVRSNTGRFSVTLADNDTDNNLNLSTPSQVTGEYIPAGLTVSNDTVDANTAGWGVKGGAISAWTAVPVSTGTPLTIVSSGTNATNPLAYSSATTVNYGVATGATKTGVYSDVVTYTATAL